MIPRISGSGITDKCLDRSDMSSYIDISSSCKINESSPHIRSSSCSFPVVSPNSAPEFSVIDVVSSSPFVKDSIKPRSSESIY